MTREEAISRIKNHMIIHKMNEPRAILIDEALAMAIKALEQEPCREADDYENEISDLYNRLDIAEYDKERLREEVTTLEEKLKGLSAEPCGDAISRRAVLALAKEECETAIIPYRRFVKDINALSPVNPQQKTGHWIYDDEHSGWYTLKYECSCCKREIIVRYEAKDDVYKDYPYCHCGAKMVESEEV